MSNKSTLRNIPIEQLQYIEVFKGDGWEFRLRAASSGLSGSSNKDIYTLRGSFPSYIPPRGVEPLISGGPFDGPRSLVFVRTEQYGGILAHKVYGSAQGTPQVNMHMLVGLPQEFSLKEAITFWGSSFWNRDIQGPLFLNDLRIMHINPFLTWPFSRMVLPREREQATTYLPFVLQCALLQRAIVDHPERERRVPRILIIAPATQVAYLISALSHLLPQQLLHDLTFNTYENDIMNQQYRICGKDLSFEEKRDISEIDLSSYETDFILNIHNKENVWRYMPTDFPPDLFDKVSYYVEFAAKAFKHDFIDLNLRNFLKKLEKIARPDEKLTLDAFLKRYHEAFGGPPTLHPGIQPPQGHPSEEVSESETTVTIPLAAIKASKNQDRTEAMLHELMKNDSSSHIDGLSLEQVSKAGNTPSKSVPTSLNPVQRESRDLDPTEKFSHTHTQANTGLGSTQSLTYDGTKEVPREGGLEKSIMDKGNSSINRHKMIDSMLDNPPRFGNPPPDYWAQMEKVIAKPDKFRPLLKDIKARAIEAIQAGDASRFQAVLSVLSYISASNHDLLSWREFLVELASEQKYGVFIQSHWPVRKQLLTIAMRIQPLEDALVAPLLKVNPSDFCKLLTLLPLPASAGNETDQLRLPAHWSYLATRQFNASSVPLKQNIIQYFQMHSEMVEMLFKQISTLPDKHKWMVLVEFSTKLLESNYRPKKDLLFHFFKNNPPQDIAELVAKRLDEQEQVELFQQYEKLCIRFFPTSERFQIIVRRCFHLSTFHLRWTRINSIIDMLSELQKAGSINMYMMEVIAEMLDACIDSPIRLSTLFSPLVERVDAGTVRTLLATMAQHVRNEFLQLTATEGPREHIQFDGLGVKARFSAYVQFALRVDATYDSRVKFGDNLLNHLLDPVDKRVFVFIDHEAQYWPAELRWEWAGLRKNYRPSEMEVMRGSPSSPPENRTELSPVDQPFPGGRPNKVELSVELATLLVKAEPRLLERLNNLVEKKEARKLAGFWVENYVLLMLMDRQLIGQDKWDQMQFAYDFCEACRGADNAPKKSQESIKAEQAIVDASNESHSRGDLLNFTRRERNRIKLAEKKLQTVASNSP